MPENQEKERSIEQMVEDAQNKSSATTEKKSETREVVVREDGSKVVKVRRKKRKNKSTVEMLADSEEEKQSYVKLLLVSLAFFAVVAAILAGYFFVKVSFYNSPDHITNLERYVSSRLKSEVDVQGYRLGPTSSQMDKITILSTNKNLPYVSAEVSNIMLSHRPESVVLGELNGTEAVADSCNVILDYTRKVGKQKPSKEGQPESIPYIYTDLDIKELSIALGSNEGSPRFSKMTGKLFKRSDGNIQLFLREGSVSNLNGFPKTLDSAILINKAESVEIKSLKFSNADVGFIDVKGTYPKKGEGSQTLTANFDKLRLENLDPFLESLLEARVSSENGVLLLNASKAEYSLSADLKVTDGGASLKKFLFLETIGKKFGKFGYPYVSFTDSPKFSIEIDGEGYKFTNIDFEKQSDLAVEGAFSVGFDGTLAGHLKVGLPTGKVIRQFPEVNEESLTTSRGFSWFDVTLSGTTRDPRDNFSEQFDSIVDLLE